MPVLHALAFYAVLGVCLVRIPTAWAEPRARISWLASAFGVLALLTLGAVIPQESLDLGGQNWLKLAQGIFTIAAFWMLTMAATSDEQVTLATLPWRPLLSALGCLVIIFALIEKVPGTDPLFIENNVDRVDVYAYGVAHMVVLAFVSMMLIRGATSKHGGGYMLLAAGGWAAYLACLSEVADLTLVHFQLAERAQQVVSLMFDLLFYPGVVALVIGIGILAATRKATLRRTRGLVADLDQLALEHGLEAPPFGAPFGLSEAPDALLGRFQEWLDYCVHTGITLTDTEARTMLKIDQELSRAGRFFDSQPGVMVYEANA